MDKTRFEWDEAKDRLNQRKHGVPFALAQYAFADPCRVILEDMSIARKNDVSVPWPGPATEF